MRNTKRLISLLLVLLTVISFAACNKAPLDKEVPGQDTTSGQDSGGQDTTAGVEMDGLWKDATYAEDKSFGEGAKTITVKVTAEDKSVVFTIKTDKETLGDALTEHGLVEGEQGQFGLYIKTVNGITADYDIDKTYWSISKDGQDLMTGADGEKILGGENYELARKQ